MNKKTIIFCCILIAVLLAGAAVAVYFLYYGDKTPEIDSYVDLSDSRSGFFCAVPADAVTVMYFSGPASAASMLAGERPSVPLVPDGPFRTFLSRLGESDGGRLGPLRGAQTIVSGHYVGGFEPLMVMDIGRSGANVPSQADRLKALADTLGLYCRLADCSETAVSGTYLKGRRIMIVSTSDVLGESAERHVAKGVSVLDKEYFTQALNSVKGEKTCLFISCENAGKAVEGLFGRDYRRHSDFFRRAADWCAFSVDDSSGSLRLAGATFCGSGANKFMNVFSDLAPASVTAFGMIPSYAVSAFAMPVTDVGGYIEAYNEYFNTKSGRVKYAGEQARLKKEAGVSPSSWAQSLGVRELAAASFYVGDELESVLLIRSGSASAASGRFPLSGDAKVGDYAYAGFVSSLFGPLFSAREESKFTVMKDWIVVGSPAAVDEYVGGRALETSLDRYLDGAGLAPDLRNQYFTGYFSLSQDPRAVDRLFAAKSAAQVKASYEGVMYVPALLSLNAVKGQRRLSLRVDRVDMVRGDAPEIERDAVVTVTNGRYSVKNSGTGKMNTFYQQDNMYLCLSDENGKGLWGVAFSTPICGRAGTVDYFANGKLQILFASGSKLYLIDRLGRFVNPFPVELGKEVLLGPDIYDFSGQRRYNVMVLHKDNTVEMYNLAGRKPDGWKGITFSETIMGLPERVDVGGKTYWIVRTSLQTLVYPFYGGEPLTAYKGNNKLRPDTKVTVTDGGLRAVNYAGKEVTVTLGR